MNATVTVLDVRNVTKSFTGFLAVKGLSLTLRQGERRGLIGPNGAGKTTLFNLVSGRLRPDSGEILYRDRPIQSLSPHKIARLGLARTFQITSIYPRLTPLQNIQVAVFACAGRSRNLFRAADRTDVDKAMTVLGDVGLDGVAQHESGLLSYGDQKRLELALALALKPNLLLLDEPTAGMESRTRRGMVDLILRLCAERELTLLFCEHDMDAVFSIADVITVMHQGQVLVEGAPAEVRRSAEVRAIYLGGRHQHETAA
jgi:branched-chain amino acid transport system ATP-binding protein